MRTSHSVHRWDDDVRKLHVRCDLVFRQPIHPVFPVNLQMVINVSSKAKIFSIARKEPNTKWKGQTNLSLLQFFLLLFVHAREADSSIIQGVIVDSAFLWERH